MSERFTYRQATIDDLDRLYELWWKMQTSHHEFDRQWYEPEKQEESKPIWLNHWRDAVEDPEAIIFVAETADGIIGYVKAGVGGRPLILENQLKIIAVGDALVEDNFRGAG